VTPEPLENSRYPDLPHSLEALERAARRAREIAAHTGTAIVIQREDRIERLWPTIGPLILPSVVDFTGHPQ